MFCNELINYAVRMVIVKRYSNNDNLQKKKKMFQNMKKISEQESLVSLGYCLSGHALKQLKLTKKDES